ncbi:hypothetical protein OAM92_01595 [Acidimicrobiales bacterium]|nr:hypothetical protein [Acidimicrobiales bacterium]
MTSTQTSPADSALETVIDLDAFPLDRPDSAELLDLIAAARRDLAASGCACLRGFVQATAHAALSEETDRVAPAAFKNTQHITPYADFGGDDWPTDHPRRRTGLMTNGFVGKDLIDDDSIVKSIYSDERFKTFIAACLSLDELHEFADPIRGLVVNVMDDGEQMPWHYDANEFIVSLMTRRPEGGGRFDYCPDLRQPGDERYDEVKNVLDGDESPAHSLDLQVGDLQIFKGRYSMHRVTPVEGSRHTVLFGYSEMPGYIGGVESTRIGYGRVTQAHLDAEAAGRHDDGLAG